MLTREEQETVLKQAKALARRHVDMRRRLERSEISPRRAKVAPTLVGNSPATSRRASTPPSAVSRLFNGSDQTTGSERGTITQSAETCDHGL